MSGIDEASAGKAPAVPNPGQGLVLTARGSVMAFKAVAEQTDSDFSLMSAPFQPGAAGHPAEEPPSPEQERDLMARYGMNPA
jgi:hypothetical protein